MSDRLQELTVFVRVAESGSFSRAGRELGLSQPSVSRIMSELEARLGVRLLLRTTRQISVTDAGQLFLERARDILAGLEDAEDAARGVDSLRGLIRIALPVLYGTRRVMPRLAKFLKSHPLLRVELTVADARQDLVAEGADVAIRVGRLADSAFGARKLETLSRFAVAAPSYLKMRGTPATPAELSRHDCVVSAGGAGRDTWTFRKGDSILSVDVTGHVRTDSGFGVHNAVTAGLGVAILSDAGTEAELRARRLVRLLPDYTVDPFEVHALFPGGPRPSAKVRAFVDFLATELKASAASAGPLPQPPQSRPRPRRAAP